MPPTHISEGIIQTLCRPGHGKETCCYLVHDGRAFSCARTDPSLVWQIEARVEAGTMRAGGKNCTGPPDFRPIARHDLPASLYPFTIEALSPAGEVVWTKTVQLPAEKDTAVIEIPGLKQQFGFPVWIRCRFADGSVREYPPPTEGPTVQ